MAFGGEVDALGALVVAVAFAGQVPELLELAEEVVEGLFGHARMDRKIQGALVFGAGVAPHLHVRGDEVGEAALVQPGEHSLAHGFPGDAQQRPDQRSRWFRANIGLSKVT